MHKIIVLLIIALTFAMQGFARESEENPNLKNMNETQNKPLCREIGRMINDKTIGRYYLSETSCSKPNNCEYRNLDIDNDGEKDVLMIDSSGSEGSFLMMQLSTGKEYDLEPGGFVTLYQIRKKIYVLVNHWIWIRKPDGSSEGKLDHHSLYLLTGQGIELVCQNISRGY